MKHLTAPLFDSARFTLNLEQAYRMMWEIFTKGESRKGLTCLCGNYKGLGNPRLSS